MITKVKRQKLNGKSYRQNLYLSIFIGGIIFCFSPIVFGQKVAILTPEITSQSEAFADKLSDSLSIKFNVIDLSLAESVLKTKNFQKPFNLTTQDAKNLAVSIGCNFFIIIKTDTYRRSTFDRNEFYESFAVFYLVSSRTGRLVYWKLNKFDEDTPQIAKANLFSAVDKYANEITKQIKTFTKKEFAEKPQKINELPDVNSPDSKGLRPPLPYSRLKPKYTDLAAIYSLIATVDILVDIDEKGKVTRTEVIRWAGFGLDESVIKTVKTMNWRPADRNGKRIPMRVLLRYNFRNIETD